MIFKNSMSLSEAAEIIRGVSFQRGEGKSTTQTNHLPVIRAGNIQEELNLNEDLIWVPQKNISKKQQIKKNDLIMCTSSGSAEIVGKCARSECDWQGSFGAFCVGIRARQKICDAAYLFYYLRSPIFKNWSRKAGGANIKNIRKSELEEFNIPLPPLPEQKRISAILDKASAIRRKRQQAIKLTDEFLRATFLDMFGDPVTNQKGWPFGTIRELISEAKYGTAKKASIDTGEYPILRMNNITYNGEMDFTDLKYIDLEEKEVSKYIAKKGDLLFNRTNSKELVGKTAVFESSTPMAIAGYLIRVRTNERSTPHYISSYLNSSHGKATLMGMCKSIVGMANINAQELQNISIMVPPVDLQKQYTDLVWKVQERKKRRLEAANIGDTLFRSLTQRVFRGEL